MQLFEESKFNQWYFRPEVRSHFKLGKNILTSGIGINYEILDRTYFENKATLNSEYIFGQYEWFLNKKWNFLLGFRYDNHHQYKSQLSPKVAINYKWNEHFSLKSSIGYGYKAPDLRQLYFDFTNATIGYTVLGYNVAKEKLEMLQNQGQLLFTENINFNNPLKPENSINLNIGGYYQKDKWSFDYNFFYNAIDNLIDNKAIAQRTNGQNIFSYFNVDKIYTYGLECNSSLKVNNRLTITTGYQYLIAQDQSVVNKIEDGKIFAKDLSTLSSFKLKQNEYFGLFNRSKHTANLKVSYQIPAIKSSINFRLFYKSKYGIFDINNNDILDKYDNFVKGYVISNITAHKDLKKNTSTQVGISNILNYTDRNNVSNLPGRQFFIRIQYQF